MTGPIVGVGFDGNWDQTFSGAGPVDSAMQIVKSFVDDDPLAAFGNVAAGALDLLGVMENPLKVIGTSAMGWLIEHLWFLDGFLDNTAGDPVAIDNAVTALHNSALALDKLAADQFTSYENVKVFRLGISQSKQPFEERVEPRAEQLKLQSVKCLGLSQALSVAGMLVATVRGLIRDLLAEFAWWVLQVVTAATAAAPFTGGGSLATAAGHVVLSGSNLATRLTSALTECVGQLQGLSAKLKLLAQLTLESLIPAGAKYTDDTGDLYAPSSYERAQQEAAPPPPPPPPLPPPWQTSGTLDEP
jgi:hypothetical protein